MAAKLMIEVQYQNLNIKISELEKGIKTYIKEQGYKISDFKEIKIYYVPEKTEVYYNLIHHNEEKGCIAGNMNVKILLDKIESK